MTAAAPHARDVLHATPLHAEILAALHATSFPAPWRTEEFTSLLLQPGVAAWIGLKDATPAGFIMVRAVADEAEILTIAVTPSQRRCGLGAHLITHARAALAAGDTARLFLEVAADNVAALALYERSDFKVCGKRANYYISGGGKPVDAVLMSLAIKS